MEFSDRITSLRKEIKTCEEIEKESIILKEEIKEFKRQNEKKKEVEKSKVRRKRQIL